MMREIKQYFRDNGSTKEEVWAKTNATIMLYNIIDKTPMTLNIILKYIDDMYKELKEKANKYDTIETLYEKLCVYVVRKQTLDILLENFSVKTTKNVPQKYMYESNNETVQYVDSFIKLIMNTIKNQIQEVPDIQNLNKQKFRKLLDKIKNEVISKM